MKAKLVELVLWAISFFSIPAQRRLGRWLGRRLYKKQGRDYKITLRNIQACFPELSVDKQEDLALNSLQATATTAMETPAVWFRGKKWRDRDVLQIENQRLFDEALASGRGIILLVPHFGNWELAGLWVAEFRSVTALYRTPKMKSLDSLLRKVRENEGANTTVPVSSRGVLALVKALKQGGMTIILPDQQPEFSGGIFSPFCGQSALTVTLINRLIVKTDPVVLIAYARRAQDGHVIGFQEPDAEIYSTDPQVSADAMNRSIEQLVSTAPEQYQWEYKRFRKQPDGAAPFYH
jgi:KDO2-lipid IV(A) lauroyltransferase